MTKRDDLSAFICDNNSSIVILTESWLKPEINDSEIFPVELQFDVYRCDSISKRGGGVLIAIKKSVSSFCVRVCPDLETVFVCITSAFRQTIIGACYRAPSRDSDYCDNLHSVLLNIQGLYPKAQFLIFGDFNFPDIDWVNYTTSGSNDAKKFLDNCLNFNLIQVVNQPTRGDNILDLVLTSSPELIENVDSVPGLSDHNILLIELSIPVLTRNPTIKTIRDFNKADYVAINQHLSSFYQTYAENFFSRSVEENWLLFKNKINSLTEQFVPSVTVRSDRNNPWYNKTLRSLNNKKKTFV